MGMTFKIDWQYGGYTGHLDYTFDWEQDEFHPGESDKEVFSGQSFWWFEGNGSCDCNRFGMVMQESGQFPWAFQNAYNWDIEEGDRGCGINIIFTHVEFWRDGRLIGTGRDAEWGYGRQYKESPVVIPTILEQALILQG